MPSSGLIGNCILPLSTQFSRALKGFEIFVTCNQKQAIYNTGRVGGWVSGCVGEWVDESVTLFSVGR